VLLLPGALLCAVTAVSVGFGMALSGWTVAGWVMTAWVVGRRR
jgi:hypothetical protein